MDLLRPTEWCCDCKLAPADVEIEGVLEDLNEVVTLAFCFKCATKQAEDNDLQMEPDGSFTRLDPVTV